MKILSVFGTRPEAIKMAPLINCLVKCQSIESIVCNTSQHKDMLEPIIRFFGIKSQYNLNIMRPNQTLNNITSDILNRLSPILQKEKPDWVLVQGDTTTTLSASLASFYARIKIGHVEAGLRTGDNYAPYPEEMNRKITTALANLHFTPTNFGKNNLLKEGVSESKIFVTGNTVVDALNFTLSKILTPNESNKYEKTLLNLGVQLTNRIILVTGHRRESIGVNLTNICKALIRIAESYPDVSIIYPVHMNPNVRRQVLKILENQKGVYLIDPLDYPTFVWLMTRSSIILTDSGGIQEEAPSLGIPVLVMRNVTERQESIDLGVGQLIGTEPNNIFDKTKLLLDRPIRPNSPHKNSNPYGDGSASIRIVKALLNTD